MNIFSVYLNPNKPDPMQSLIFVKEGFAWWALVVSIFWALYHRMWMAFLLLMVMETIFATIEVKMLASQPLVEVLRIGVYVLFASIAKDWYQHVLKKRGYLLVDIVVGKNEEAAELRFLDRYMAKLNHLDKKESHEASSYL
ncbi:MAG: DUF2628 domain-containing protein [Burkholderiales bacterium]